MTTVRIHQIFSDGKIIFNNENEGMIKVLLSHSHCSNFSNLIAQYWILLADFQLYLLAVPLPVLPRPPEAFHLYLLLAPESPKLSLVGAGAVAVEVDLSGEGAEIGFLLTPATVLFSGALVTGAGFVAGAVTGAVFLTGGAVTGMTFLTGAVTGVGFLTGAVSVGLDSTFASFTGSLADSSSSSFCL